jgi:hypothetical protein
MAGPPHPTGAFAPWPALTAIRYIRYILSKKQKSCYKPRLPAEGTSNAVSLMDKTTFQIFSPASL